jgi:hypothetical protein
MSLTSASTLGDSQGGVNGTWLRRGGVSCSGMVAGVVVLAKMVIPALILNHFSQPIVPENLFTSRLLGAVCLSMVIFKAVNDPLRLVSRVRQAVICYGLFQERYGYAAQVRKHWGGEGANLRGEPSTSEGEPL